MPWCCSVSRTLLLSPSSCSRSPEGTPQTFAGTMTQVSRCWGGSHRSQVSWTGSRAHWVCLAVFGCLAHTRPSSPSCRWWLSWVDAALPHDFGAYFPVIVSPFSILPTVCSCLLTPQKAVDFGLAHPTAGCWFPWVFQPARVWLRPSFGAHSLSCSSQLLPILSSRSSSHPRRPTTWFWVLSCATFHSWAIVLATAQPSWSCLPLSRRPTWQT